MSLINARVVRGFTLIELLVVIAIIAIMMAIMVPMASAVNDRSRIDQCDAHLQQVGTALRMYAEDHGRYPAKLKDLFEGRYIDRSDLLRCERGEHEFYYSPPVKDAARDAVLMACVNPTTQAGGRPHGHGMVNVVLQLDGAIRLDDAGRK